MNFGKYELPVDLQPEADKHKQWPYIVKMRMHMLKQLVRKEVEIEKVEEPDAI
jgi:hypothetical protein